eukprot:6191730-Pleurochrysis_carterae.AAC.1
MNIRAHALPHQHQSTNTVIEYASVHVKRHGSWLAKGDCPGDDSTLSYAYVRAVPVNQAPGNPFQSNDGSGKTRRL